MDIVVIYAGFDSSFQLRKFPYFFLRQLQTVFYSELKEVGVLRIQDDFNTVHAATVILFVLCELLKIFSAVQFLFTFTG